MIPSMTLPWMKRVPSLAMLRLYLVMYLCRAVLIWTNLTV